MSSQLVRTKHIILLTVFVAMLLVVAVFVFNKSSDWHNQGQLEDFNFNSKQRLGLLSQEQKQELLIKDEEKLKDMRAFVNQLQVSDEIFLSRVLVTLDSYVVTGDYIQQQLNEYQRLGLAEQEFFNLAQNYFDEAVEAIVFFNKLYWQSITNDIDWKLVSDKNDFFVSLKEVLISLEKYLTWQQEMIVVKIDKPVWCAAANVRAVYNCEGGKQKAIIANLGGGYQIYDKQTGETINCPVVAPQYVKEDCLLECIETVNVCD